MKIRVTLLTENDKHFDESLSKESIEKITKEGWQLIMDLFCKDCDDNSTAIVESCELIER